MNIKITVTKLILLFGILYTSVRSTGTNRVVHNTT